MATFNSYVSLPEGKSQELLKRADMVSIPQFDVGRKKQRSRLFQVGSAGPKWTMKNTTIPWNTGWLVNIPMGWFIPIQPGIFGISPIR